MSENEIRDFIINHLRKRLELLGVSEKEIKKKFDFVQSGLLDSMSFVDMITAMEDHFGVEIDFEEEPENESFTSLGGLQKVFLKQESNE